MNDQNKAMDSRSIEEIANDYLERTDGTLRSRVTEAIKVASAKAVQIALKKASEEAEIHWPVENNLNPTVNRQHILDLEPEILKELGIE